MRIRVGDTTSAQSRKSRLGVPFNPVRQIYRAHTVNIHDQNPIGRMVRRRVDQRRRVLFRNLRVQGNHKAAQHKGNKPF
jgi:hypothetical protein